jgi:hypothetical protein
MALGDPLYHPATGLPFYAGDLPRYDSGEDCCPGWSPPALQCTDCELMEVNTPSRFSATLNLTFCSNCRAVQVSLSVAARFTFGSPTVGGTYDLQRYNILNEWVSPDTCRCTWQWYGPAPVTITEFGIDDTTCSNVAATYTHWFIVWTPTSSNCTLIDNGTLSGGLHIWAHNPTTGSIRLVWYSADYAMCDASGQVMTTVATCGTPPARASGMATGTITMTAVP